MCGLILFSVLWGERDELDLRPQFSFQLLARLEPLDLLHQSVHVVDASVHGGKPNVRDVVDMPEPLDHPVADGPAGHIVESPVQQLALDLFRGPLERLAGNGPALAGPEHSSQDLLPVERLAPPVALDDVDHDAHRPFKRSEASEALRALPAAPDRIPVLGGPGIENLAVGATA